MTATEYVILVDENDQIIGKSPKIYAHQKALLHRAFSVFIYRIIELSNGDCQIEWLLQQRAFDKYHSGGAWTNTCCSHPVPDEATSDAAVRRLEEEMGIHTDLQLAGTFQYQAPFANGLTEHEIDHVFVGKIEPNKKFQINPAEVAAFRFVETSELAKELAENPEKFSPWFKQAWEIAMSKVVLPS